MKHLVTPRLLMRPFASGDLTDFQALCSDPAVMKHITNGIPMTPEKSRELLEKLIHDFEHNGYGMFAVIERKEKRFIGQCGLQPLEQSGLIELGYLFVPSAWGKGFATEASKEVLRAGLGEWGLERIVGITSENNRPSIRVMEKLGMVYSGKQRFYNKDVALYDIRSPRMTTGPLFQTSYRRPTKLSMPAL